MFLVTVIGSDVITNCDGMYVLTHPCSWYCVRIQYVLGSDFSVILRREVFGEVVCEIGEGSLPSDAKLFFSFFISQPVKTHIPRFGAFLGDIVIGERRYCCVVRDDCCGWLLMAEGGKYMTYGNSDLGVVKNASSFSFGGGSHDMAECFTLDQNW